jgi:hypothetical protein
MAGDRSVSAGRDIKGTAAATGDLATATATTYLETVPRDTNVDLKEELAAVRKILAGLDSVDRKALSRLEEAEEEAGKPEPDLGEIEKLVGQATNYAKAAAGFTERIGNLVPPLTKIGAWLGRAWTEWGPTLGL